MSLGRGEKYAQELELMTTLKIPQADKDKAKQLIETIDKMGRRFSDFTLKAGLGYGNNVSSWPNGGETTSSSGVNAGMPDPIYKNMTGLMIQFAQLLYRSAGPIFLNDAGILKQILGFPPATKMRLIRSALTRCFPFVLVFSLTSTVG